MIDPYEKVIIPFTGGLRSFHVLLWAAQRRKDITILYVKNLHPWSGDREWKSVQEICQHLLSYWGETINKKIVVEVLSETERYQSHFCIMGESKRITAAQSILLQKCQEHLKSNHLDKILLPSDIFDYRVLEHYDTEVIPTPINSIQIQYELFHEICSHDNSTGKLFLYDFNVFKYLTPCKTDDITFAKRFISNASEYQGCCGVCSNCTQYEYTMEQLEEDSFSTATPPPNENFLEMQENFPMPPKKRIKYS